jgi:tetratricopeptide (TPR) repeat protein
VSRPSFSGTRVKGLTGARAGSIQAVRNLTSRRMLLQNSTVTLNVPGRQLSTPDLLWQGGWNLVNEGNSFLERAEWNQALGKLDEAMTLAPQIPGLQWSRARCLAKVSRSREAVHAALAALMEKPGNPEALGIICEQLALTAEEIQSRPQPTLQLLDQILQASQQPVGGVQQSRALCLQVLGKTDEAIGALELEMKANPANVEAQAFLDHLRTSQQSTGKNPVSTDPLPVGADSKLASVVLSSGGESAERRSLDDIRQCVVVRKEKELRLRQQQLQDLRRRMAADPYCQKFTIGDDGRPVPTPNEQTEVKLRTINSVYPADLTGKTVLDIGTNLGYFAFESFFRGAIRVVGLEQDLERAQLIQEVNRFFRSGVELYPDRFSLKMAEKYGEFDLTFVCSCYHYFYLEYRDHDRIMQELARATRQRLIFEGPLDLQDVSWRKHVANQTAIPASIVEQEFTPDRILGTARRHFREVRFVGPAQYLPHRHIWIFEK